MPRILNLINHNCDDPFSKNIYLSCKNFLKTYAQPDEKKTAIRKTSKVSLVFRRPWEKIPNIRALAKPQAFKDCS